MKRKKAAAGRTKGSEKRPKRGDSGAPGSSGTGSEAIGPGRAGSGADASPPEARPRAGSPIWGRAIRCAYDSILPVGDLKPNPRNPNRHNRAQIALLAKNIAAFGWRHPIVVSSRSGFIVAGHARLEAAKKLGLAQVPVDLQDFATDAEELAVLVSDNRLAELAELAIPSVVAILRELGASGLDQELSGYDDAVIKELLDAVIDVPLPDENKSVDDKNLLKTKYECPSCGFKW